MQREDVAGIVYIVHASGQDAVTILELCTNDNAIFIIPSQAADPTPPHRTLAGGGDVSLFTTCFTIFLAIS